MRLIRRYISTRTAPSGAAVVGLMDSSMAVQTQVHFKCPGVVERITNIRIMQRFAQSSARHVAACPLTPPRRSVPGQRQSRNVNDTTEKKWHFEARFDLKLRNRRQEFRNSNLDLAPREMLAEAAMGIVAEREVRCTAVQSDFIGRFVGLRVAPGKGGRHCNEISRHHPVSIELIWLAADTLGRHGRITTQQLLDGDGILQGVVVAHGLLVAGSRGQMMEMQTQIRGYRVEAAQIQIEAVAEHFNVRPSAAFHGELERLADQIVARVLLTVLDGLQQQLLDCTDAGHARLVVSPMKQLILPLQKLRPPLLWQ